MPTYIFGPSILPLTKGPESLSFSNKLVWDCATGGAEGKGHAEVDWPVMVDVRDVARAHVLALTEEKAAGQRFIVNSESFVYSDVSWSFSIVQIGSHVRIMVLSRLLIS